MTLTYNNSANLQTGALARMEFDEQGRSLYNGSGPFFWTGMNDDATTSNLGTCSSWTLTSGSTSVGSVTELNRPDFNLSFPDDCGNLERLICLEENRAPRPPPPPTTTRFIFVTATTFTGNFGGISGADTRCQTAASAANRTGVWKAFLATAGATGISRIADVGPWYQQRADGGLTLTYNNVANLQTGALARLEYDEQGRSLYNGSGPFFWTGMNDDATTSSLGTCTSWTSTSGSTGVGSVTELSRPDFNLSFPDDCANLERLLCIQQ